MADLTTMSGGASIHHASLSAQEHQVALKALEKLKSTGGVSRGSAASFSGDLRSAAKPGSALITPKSEKFAGGVSSSVKPSVGSVIGSDTVVAGSALTKSELSTKSGVGTETIKVEGVTAALVKNEAATKSAAHTIVMPDKTNITLSGISTHDLFKH